MQNAVTQRLSNARNWIPNTPDRWTAVAIWLVGVWTTRQAVIEMGLKDIVSASIAAAVAQWILTRVERRVWLGKFGAAPIAALVVDVILNAAGVLPLFRNFGATSVWRTLQEVSNNQAPFQLYTAIVISLIVGYFLARTPEELYD